MEYVLITKITLQFKELKTLFLILSNWYKATFRNILHFSSFEEILAGSVMVNVRFKYLYIKKIRVPALGLNDHWLCFSYQFPPAEN